MVCEASCHLVIWSSGHPVIGHPVIWSSSHSVIKSPSHFSQISHLAVASIYLAVASLYSRTSINLLFPIRVSTTITTFTFVHCFKSFQTEINSTRMHQIEDDIDYPCSKKNHPAKFKKILDIVAGDCMHTPINIMDCHPISHFSHLDKCADC